MEEGEEDDGMVAATAMLEAGRYYIGIGRASIATGDSRSVVDCLTDHSRPDSLAGTEPSLGGCNHDGQLAASATAGKRNGLSP